MNGNYKDVRLPAHTTQQGTIGPTIFMSAYHTRKPQAPARKTFATHLPDVQTKTFARLMDLIWRKSDALPNLWCPRFCVCGQKLEEQEAMYGGGPAYAPYGVPGGYPQHIPNYLVQAILVTIFCCLPLGIVSYSQLR